MYNNSENAVKPILEVKDLAISYETRNGDVAAVRGVNFWIAPGNTYGLVGESGCGKSTIAFGLLDFLGKNGKIVDGSILFDGKELVGLPKHELQQIRGNQISMVYQDPMQALNPTLTIGKQLSEVLTCHLPISKADALEKSVRMLERVYMPDPGNVISRYPHQLSGGQQQRVVIAMAMLNSPKLLIMDEPTTALDVTVEATVLDLVDELKKEFNTGILFISHNLGVVARVSDWLMVMYAGEMIEKGSIKSIFSNPSHPYTRGLLDCVPRLGTHKSNSTLNAIKGRVPPPAERSSDDCIFHPRCDVAMEQCLAHRPEPFKVGLDHYSRCFRALKGDNQLEPVLPITSACSSSEFAKAQSNDLNSDDVKNSSILSIKDMKVFYESRSKSLKRSLGFGEKKYIKAVDGVNLDLKPSTTLGIVGESGCGKSSLVKGLIGLEPLSDGKIEFLNVDISKSIRNRHLQTIQEMQMVFQNPDSTLNPSYTVGKQILRPIKRFKTVPKKERKAEVYRLLKSVKLGKYYYNRYPKQLSGGEKQRVGIARALASRPNLVVCDEPVSALDVSVQAAVMSLLIDLQLSLGTTFIFIAHDLSVVRYLSDFVYVMYLGHIVEYGPAKTIYAPPYHPYSEALLSAIPIPEPDLSTSRVRLHGEVPNPLNPPSGCKFHTRCFRRASMLPDNGKICEKKTPPWQDAGNGHKISCHIPVEKLALFESVLPNR